MQETLTRSKLELVHWCHLPPVSVLVPFVPIDRENFPAAKEGFEDFSMVSSAGYFGGSLAFIDISGLTNAEVKLQVKKDFLYEVWVDNIRLLQSLEFLEGPHGLCSFEGRVPVQIVAYCGPGDATVVVPLPGGGFKRVERPDPIAPWEKGTWGLFHVAQM